MSVNLFTGVQDFEDYDNIVKSLKKKRVHYVNPSYIKVYKNDKNKNGDVINDDVELWGRMKELYNMLVDFFPFSLGQEKEDYYFLRKWRERYTQEIYKYKGTTYKGQEFQINEVEVIGTEKFDIHERLFIHESILNFLKEGTKIEELQDWVNGIIEWFNNGGTVYLYYFLLIFIEVIGGANEQN